jgi:hypothetical protein
MPITGSWVAVLCLFVIPVFPRLLHVVGMLHNMYAEIMPDKRFTHLEYMLAFIIWQVMIIQIKCFHEIITIGYVVYKSHELPWFRTLSWYFLICSNYFFYGESMIQYFGVLLARTVSCISTHMIMMIGLNVLHFRNSWLPSSPTTASSPSRSTLLALLRLFSL